MLTLPAESPHLPPLVGSNAAGHRKTSSTVCSRDCSTKDVTVEWSPPRMTRTFWASESCSQSQLSTLVVVSGCTNHALDAIIPAAKF